jgi:hypothetical protein
VFEYSCSFHILRQFLANLWARHTGLQCSYNQESFDLLIAIYTFKGPIGDHDVFDPERLSACFTQVKLKVAGDLKAGNALCPVGIHLPLTQSLPYIALHLELGCEMIYRESKITSSSPKPAPDGQFEKLTGEWIAAAKQLKLL